MQGSRTMMALAGVLLALAMSSDALGARLNWAGTGTVHLFEDDNANAHFYGGGVATVNGTSGVIPAHLDEIRFAPDRGMIAGEHTHFVTDPEVTGSGLAAVQYLDVEALTGTVGGSFATGPRPGPIPIGGIVNVCLLSPACSIYIPLAMTVPTTVNGVPGDGRKGIGIGGLLTMGGYGGIRVSVQAAPWTVGTASGQNVVETLGGSMVVSTWTMAGWVHGPVSSTVSSTAAPGGMMEVVTPVQIATNAAFGFGHPQGRFAGSVGSVLSMTILFIPEPGLLLLLGSGVAGLGVLGRLRR